MTVLVALDPDCLTTPLAVARALCEMSINPTEQTVIKPLGMFSLHSGGEENAEGQGNEGRDGVYKDEQGAITERKSIP